MRQIESPFKYTFKVSPALRPSLSLASLGITTWFFELNLTVASKNTSYRALHYIVFKRWSKEGKIASSLLTYESSYSR